MQTLTSSNSTKFMPKLSGLLKKKYLILFIFAGSLFMSEELWEGLVSITPEAEIYFDKNSDQINWFSTVFLIVLAIEAIPSLYFPNFLGLKYCIIIGSSLNTFGCVLRFASTFLAAPSTRYIICLIGNISGSLAQGFLLNLSPYLSSIWFEPNERNTCTGIIVGSSYLGIAVGFFLPTGIIQLFGGDLHKSFFTFFLVELIFTGSLLLITIIFMEDRPNEPLKSTGEDDPVDSVVHWKTLLKQMVDLFLKIDVVLVLLVYGLFYATSAMFYTFFSEYFDFYAVQYSKESGFIGSAAVICGSFCIYLTGILISKYGNWVSSYFGVTYNLICLLSIILFIIIFSRQSYNLAVLIIISLLYGFPSLSNDSYGLERLSEMIHPSKPYVGSTAALIMGTLFSSLFIYLLGLLEKEKKYMGSLILSAVCYLICAVIELYFTCMDISRRKRRTFL